MGKGSGEQLAAQAAELARGQVRQVGPGDGGPDHRQGGRIGVGQVQRLVPGLELGLVDEDTFDRVVKPETMLGR